MADRDMPTACSGGNPTSITDMIAAYRAAHGAFGAVHAETIVDEEGDAYQQAQRRYGVARSAVLDARPASVAECASWLRWALEDGAIRDNTTGVPETVEHIAGVLEEVAPAPIRVRPNVEAETLDCCSAAWMLREHHYMLSPGELPADFRTWAENENRRAWLIGCVADAAHRLAVKVWGEEIAAERGLASGGEG